VNRFCFFRILPQGSGIWLNFDKKLFLWKCQKRQFQNVTSPRGDDYRIGRYFLNFALIGYKSTKKCAKMTILRIKVVIRKFKCHQKIPWV
jgi:hypothetical protein